MPKYTTIDHIELPPAMLDSWQETLDLLAETLEVPSALIMRVHAQEIEVFLSSQSPGNVYEAGEMAKLDTGLYCETVMDMRQELQVPNALTDPQWTNNPDVELGMISYCGLPLEWPSGEIFGTICVLDLKEHKFSELHRKILEQFRNGVQSGLAIVYESDQVKQLAGVLEKTNENLEQRIRERTQHLEQEITEHKITASALLHAKNEAEQAGQAKSKFLSSMSHELRTPLNSILGFAQLLEMNGREPLSAGQQKVVAHILKSGRHLLELVEEVLDLERIESGRLKLNIEGVRIEDICRECSGLMEPQIEEHGLNLVVDWGADLIVRADKTRLKQVLLNLLSNAVKYNRVGGGVTLTCEGVGHSGVRINVTDTGEGIGPEAQSQLFEPFSRLGKESSDIVGTGIGLTVTKELVEAMSGRIGFESQAGKGSTFWFELPTA